MAKITALEQKTFQGKPQGWKVTLDDGRGGNLEEKQSDKGLRVGDEVIVAEIPYTSKAGKQSILYGLRLVGVQTTQQPQRVAPPVTATPPVNPAPRPAQQSAPQTGVNTLKAQAATKALEFIINCFIADKIQWDQIQPKHKELVGYLNDAIDDCLQG